MSAIMALVNMVGGAFNKYQDRKMAEHEVLMAEMDAKKHLAIASIKAEAELGTIQIKATSKVFKYFTFFMWFGPFMLGVIFPDYGVMIFQNLNQLPEWYVQSCMVIMFAIWGIHAGRESIVHIFSGLSGFFQTRQKAKLNKQLFYEVLRSTKGNLSQREVDMYEKALDTMKLKDPD